MFRGLIQTYLMNQLSGYKKLFGHDFHVGTIVSAVIWGAFHFINILIMPFDAVVFYIALTTFAGLWMGYAYQQTKSLLTTIIVHNTLFGVPLVVGYFLYWLSAYASTAEMKERMKKAQIMLKQKAHENWGVDVDGAEWKEMIKMRTWVSRDPKMAEQIRRANNVTRQVMGMTVEMELNKEEIEGLIISIDGKYFPNNELIILKKALQSI